MNYEKILEDFIDEVRTDSSYKDVSELRNICVEAINIINSNHDSSFEEMIEKLIENDIERMEEVRYTSVFPGYTIGFNVGNINVKYFGGDLDSFGNSMREDALFDIASMSKMYTQVILYNLIKEGYLNRDSVISKIDPRFINLGDVTMGELMEFSIDFRTDGNITLMKELNEVKDKLYEIRVREDENGQVRNRYTYTDFGMMIAKEVMENVTGKSYDKLFKEYITDKLGLKDTMLIVPVKDRCRFTGSPNTRIGHVNDPKANAMGGYSGHAGVVASSDDLIKFGKGMEDGTLLDSVGLSMANSRSKFKFNRGRFGNTYIKTSDGLKSSYIEKFSPNSEFVIEGSTRVQMNVSSKAINTTLLNPSSMSLDEALELERKYNEKRISLVRHFEYNENGVLVPYHLIDSTKFIGTDITNPIETMNSKTSLRLRLLNKFILEYANYDKEIKVIKKVRK